MYVSSHQLPSLSSVFIRFCYLGDLISAESEAEGGFVVRIWKGWKKLRESE